jgi:hypothetical protein
VLPTGHGPVMVNLGCYLDGTERHLEDWYSTLLGVSLRVSPGMIGMWSAN